MTKATKAIRSEFALAVAKSLYHSFAGSELGEYGGMAIGFQCSSFRSGMWIIFGTGTLLEGSYRDADNVTHKHSKVRYSTPYKDKLM
jgi:hypothetical protein